MQNTPTRKIILNLLVLVAMLPGNQQQHRAVLGSSHHTDRQTPFPGQRVIADDGVSIEQPATEPVPYIPRSVDERGH